MSALGLFCLSPVTTAMLSVVLYSVSRPLQKFAVDKTLQLAGRALLSRFQVITIAVASMTLWGCSGSVGVRTSTPVVIANKAPGPPPHAPAHGYRHKHPDGVVLVYDSGLGLYVVSGYASVYFCEGRYYRMHHDVWETTAHFKGNWKKISSKSLPAGLQEKQVAKGNKGKKK